MSLWTRLQRRIGDIAGELVLDDYRDQIVSAEQLIKAGDLSTAIDTLEALLAAKPDHGQALILLGEARLATRQPDKAKDAFERALRLRSGDPTALVGLGIALVTLGSYELAISALGRSIAEAGGDRGVLAEAYRGLGIAWRRRGDLDKAVRELRKAVAEDGDDPDARAALGEALVADGGPYDEAQRHLERAGEGSALAFYGLGRLALIEGNPTAAGERFAKARPLADSDGTPAGIQIRLDLLLGQGDAALAERDPQRAYQFFLEALALDQRRAEVHAKIASAQRSIGDLAPALASYDRALALGAGIEVLRAAVDTAIAAGDGTRTLQWGNDLLGKDPEDTRALVARGAAMAAAQPDAARAMF
ncbi:MAG TPA: tetratricopeptide repeat protein, partial [Kofleriaceae bacterium]|nr:tetratricopeptide repeat protein [Kofleriaceae bacterium]